MLNAMEHNIFFKINEHMKQYLGFALLELIVVFIIMSILITLNTPSYKQATVKIQEIKNLSKQFNKQIYRDKIS
jgi:Tfp pilus assembly protein PilE